jgi:hypothetical protein
MTSEVSERIHACISFDKECWLLEGQEIQEDRVLGGTISTLGWWEKIS